MASSKIVTASIVVEFDQSAGEGILQVETDGREDGYNGGDTSFPPGSAPYLLLYKSSNVVIDRIVTSEGTLSLVSSSEAIDVSEFLTFSNAKSATPQHPIPAGSGTITAIVNSAETPTVSENAVTFSSPQVAVVGIDYTTVASVYQLVGASGTYPVVIYIAGHTVG